MFYFFKTLGHAINGMGEAAKKRRGKQTPSNAGSEAISVTQLSFPINIRAEGSAPHLITYLTVSKNFHKRVLMLSGLAPQT